ncbi:TetR/AcrR family transcriptional regulator [Amycolatopsis sp. GM8]|uniref:TetR/AcrR family transcriptional regulator n=1 Tax=Amycolatopsis sp. GM8 TaxID=2896530 RepID=UPI002103F902|nr:TetR/AcrR family transcriptional regulator [Amycolatopsis sp. GM8]
MGSVRPDIPDAPAPAGRPRDPALEQAILDATVDIIVRRGLSGATVEEVARQAGTGKAAVYRRWPSKTALVVAAVRALQADVSVPDTGSLREDLLACARHYTAGNERAAMLLANLLSEASRDTELREAASEAIGQPPAVALRSVVERWIERGEVDPSAPVDVLVGIIPSFAFRQVVTRGRTLDQTTAVVLVDHVLLPALRYSPGRLPDSADGGGAARRARRRETSMPPRPPAGS